MFKPEIIDVECRRCGELLKHKATTEDDYEKRKRYGYKRLVLKQESKFGLHTKSTDCINYLKYRLHRSERRVTDLEYRVKQLEVKQLEVKKKKWWDV